MPFAVVNEFAFTIDSGLARFSRAHPECMPIFRHIWTKTGALRVLAGTLIGSNVPENFLGCSNTRGRAGRITQRHQSIVSVARDQHCTLLKQIGNAVIMPSYR